MIDPDIIEDLTKRLEHQKTLVFELDEKLFTKYDGRKTHKNSIHKVAHLRKQPAPIEPITPTSSGHIPMVHGRIASCKVPGLNCDLSAINSGIGDPNNKNYLKKEDCEEALKCQAKHEPKHKRAGLLAQALNLVDESRYRLFPRKDIRTFKALFDQPHGIFLATGTMVGGKHGFVGHCIAVNASIGVIWDVNYNGAFTINEDDHLLTTEQMDDRVYEELELVHLQSVPQLFVKMQDVVDGKVPHFVGKLNPFWQPCHADKEAQASGSTKDVVRIVP